MANQHQGVEVARKMVEEVYGKGKTELIGQLVHDDYVEHDPLMGRIDRKGIENEVRMYRSAFPDLEMKVIDSVAAGDCVSVRWRASGTHRGELMGIAPSNKKTSVEGITMIRMRDGRGAEAWVQYDLFGLMRQIGAVPETAAPRPNGGGKERAAQSRR